jgi:multicomponent Na+:H+ antiporter subunit D
MLTPDGLAGAEIYCMGHAMIKGGLFLAAGILLHRTGSVDEIDLHGRPRHLRWTGGLFFLGAAGMAGVPPFGTFWGDVLMESSAERLGYGWLGWITWLAATATAGALFRFGARVFLGWGPARELFPAAKSKIQEKPDTRGGRGHTPAAMFVPAAGLIVLGALVGLAPGLTGAATAAAIHVQDRVSYAQRVLDMLAPYPPTVQDQTASGLDVIRALGTAIAAALLAWSTLCLGNVRRTVSHSRVLKSVVRGMRGLHSGIVPDYVTWLVAGVAAFGGAAWVWLR